MVDGLTSAQVRAIISDRRKPVLPASMTIALSRTESSTTNAWNSLGLRVPTGAYHTWNGTTLEGMPIEPDEQIGFGWRKRRAGIDEQLEYAVSGLGTKIARRVR
jgi:hypothetical protein